MNQRLVHAKVFIDSKESFNQLLTVLHMNVQLYVV